MSSAREKMLMKYWDKLGHVKADNLTLELFTFSIRDMGTVHRLIWEWYKSRGKDPLKPLKDDFGDLLESRNGNFLYSRNHKEFNIDGNGYSFTIEINNIILDYKNKWLEINGEIFYDTLIHYGENPFNSSTEDMDDDEYEFMIDDIKSDVYELVDLFLYNRYGSTMGVDIENAVN
jgi:hypothetical protein